jgi:glycosyltransferase involved in cell wall biosynthesis
VSLLVAKIIFELIVVDDVSHDNTFEIARSFQTQDFRISGYKNEKNLGDYANRNKAAPYARDKYIAYLDSDDYYLPDGLKYIVSMMQKNPKADWALYDPLYNDEICTMEPAQVIYNHFFVRPFLKMGPGGTI